MGRARLLDKKSSKRAGPIYSTKNRVNGNEAHLPDERLGFRLAGLLDDLLIKWDRPICLPNKLSDELDSKNSLLYSNI